jgi:hypothetical protein
MGQENNIIELNAFKPLLRNLKTAFEANANTLEALNVFTQNCADLLYEAQNSEALRNYAARRFEGGDNGLDEGTSEDIGTSVYAKFAILCNIVLAQENENLDHPLYNLAIALMQVSELAMCPNNYASDHPNDVLGAIELAGDIN